MRHFREYNFLLIAVVLAMALRFLYFQELTSEPANTYPIQDAEYHDYWAHGMATGQWAPPTGYHDPEIQQHPYFRPPGYAFFLAGIYRLTGGSVYAAVVLQMILGLMNIGLVYMIARNTAGRGAACTAAFIMAVYWPLIFFEALLLDTILHLTLMLSALLVLGKCTLLRVRHPCMNTLAGGLLLGCAAVVRPTTLLFIPIATIWMGWWLYHDRRSRIFRQLLILLLGCILAIMPVTLRNVIKTGQPVLISANGGLMLYMGNNVEATGLTGTGGLNAIQTGKYRSCFDYPAFVDYLGQQQGDELNYAQASRLLIGKALASIKHHPRMFLKSLWNKALLFWGPLEIGHNNEMHFGRIYSRVLGCLPGSFSLLLAFAIAGVLPALPVFRKDNVLSGTQGPELLISGAWTVWLLLYAAIVFLSVWPFVFSSQYRVPMIPVLAVFCGAAMWRIIYGILNQHSQTAVATAAAGLLLFALLRINHTGYTPSPAPYFYQRAAVYERLGQPQKAMAAYRQVLEHNPKHAWAHGALGTLLARSGHLPRAIDHMQQAVLVEPDYPRVRVNLAYALYLAGDTVSALQHLQYILQDNPNDHEALNTAAWILATHPDPEQRKGAQALQYALRLNKLTQYGNIQYLDTLAAAYAANDAFEKACEIAEKAADQARRIQKTAMARGLQERAEKYRKRQPHISRPAP